MTPETPGFPAVWLRHNCPCPDCRDPVTGQRLLKITDIPNDLVATVTARHDTEIVVTFAPDGHRSVFRREDRVRGPPQHLAVLGARVGIGPALGR